MHPLALKEIERRRPLSTGQKRPPAHRPRVVDFTPDPLSSPPALLGLCAGYERGQWRCELFAEYLTEWLLDFVFSEEEQAEINTFSARASLRRAARQLYLTDKYGRRGEFGELILHVVLR